MDFKTGKTRDVKTGDPIRDIPIFDPLKVFLNKRRQIDGYVISANGGATHLSTSGHRKIFKRIARELIEIGGTIEQSPDGADPNSMISVLTAH